MYFREYFRVYFREYFCVYFREYFHNPPHVLSRVLSCVLWQGLNADTPTHIGIDNVTEAPLEILLWQKKMYSYLKDRRGLLGKGIAIIDGHGHRGKNKLMEFMMKNDFKGKSIVWRNHRDNKKIVDMLTVSDEDEENEITPDLMLIWIDIARTGDNRLEDPSWFADLEVLFNGTFFPREMDMQGWGDDIRPHIVITANRAIVNQMTAGRILQHVITHPSADLGVLEESSAIAEAQIDQAIVLTRKTEEEHKHKPLEQIWIEYSYCNSNAPDEKMSITVMAKELTAKAPEIFGKYLAKKPKSGRIFAGNGKASFEKLIQKHAPNLRKTAAGSAIFFYVKKRQ